MLFYLEHIAMCIKCMDIFVDDNRWIYRMSLSSRHNNSLLLSTGFLGDVLTLKKTLDGRIKVRILSLLTRISLQIILNHLDL